MILGYIVGIIGMWVFSDSIYSITLYVNAPTYDTNKRQTWKKDHWVRAVRAALAITLMVIGAKLI